MKLSTLIINSVLALTFLTGSGLVLNKLETATLSNPFTANIAEMPESNTDV